MKLAVIGSGIAGLTVAAGLAERKSRGVEFLLFEADDRLGGHTHTVDVEEDGRTLAVDTGFIVFNDWTYPNFMALLERVGVPWQPSNMSFSLQCELTGLEYNGTSVNSLFAQRRNLFNPRFLSMIAEILRFNREAPRWLAEQGDDLSLRDWLESRRFRGRFVEHYIVPMGRAIWSAGAEQLLGFPARFFIDFFHRHGFLSVNNRPVWQVVKGGSREYVRSLIRPFEEQIRLRSPIRSVRRSASGVTLRLDGGQSLDFDAVVFACHADEALRLLEDADATETDILGAFPYTINEAILHTDASVLPRAPLARAAWNYHLRRDDPEGVAVTYDMNVLQSLDTERRYLVSLNLADRIDPGQVLGRYQYSHPVYTPAGVAAQARHADISGQRRSYFCGAHWRYGFHEDGVVSGLAVLAQVDKALDRG
ncbi:MAG: NAD(P)/FAD-dependent oxidoreductase [Steroidobacteraceae bacterium]